MELERLFRELVNAIRASDPSRLHQPHRLREIQYGLVPYRSVRHALELECSEDHEMLILRLCAGEGGYLTVADTDARRAFGEEAAGSNADLGLLQVYGDIEVTLEAQAIDRSMVDSEQESAYRPPDIAPAHDRDDDPAEPDFYGGDREAEATVIPLRTTSPASAEATSSPILEVMPVEVAQPDPEPSPEPEPAVALSSPAPPPFGLSPDDETSTTEPTTSAAQCAYCGGSLPSTRQAIFCPHCGQNLTVIQCAHCAAELEYGWHHCITCGHPAPDH
jgi:hypothetical protein